MFTLDGDRYLPLDRARGPWDREFLHGGPVAGLFAHVLETERRDEDLLMARLTVDLMQPVPVAPLHVETRVIRESRRARYVEAELRGNGAIVARAHALLLRQDGSEGGSTTLPTHAALPHWDELPPGKWGRQTSLPLFHNGVEVREIRKPFNGDPMAVWMRIPYELLPGRALTPIECAATLSDFGSGIGIMSQPASAGFFINGDITLYLHRAPEGEWICLESVGRGDRGGIASSNVNLHDTRGLFGHVSTSGLANRLSAKPGERGAET